MFRGFFTLLFSLSLCIYSSWAGSQLPKHEVRGLWISTIHNLDWPTSRHAHPEQQKEEFIRLIELAKTCNINTVYVQIRNASDAFYKSEIEPWSQWLTGKQGKEPKPFWDPLEFMIQECHKRNIEFHAWFNPFRAVSHVEFSDVCKQHISKQKKDWCFQYENTLYLDPGKPEVRDYIISIIEDVSRRYDIDGIHLDDYFYPSENANESIDDNASYFYNNKNGLSKADWRRENINLLIRSISTSTKKIKKFLKFGISPIAVWRHKTNDLNGSETYGGQAAYDDLYADVLLWLKNGWVDYVVPQLYHKINHKLADFTTLEKWWSENSFGRHIYTGHALYKLADGKEDGWNTPKELTNQIKLSRENQKIKGICLYRAWSYNTNPWNIRDSLKLDYFKHQALLPSMPWIDSIPPNSPENLTLLSESNFISLAWKTPKAASDHETPSKYVIYKFPQGSILNFNNPKYILTITNKTSYIDLSKNIKGYYYIVKSIDRLNNESIGFAGVYSKK